MLARKMVVATVLLVCAVVVIPVRGATTYYVDDTNGSDIYNDGNSLEAPFKTIQKAANTVNPGDTVLVREGTYYENGRLDIERYGTENNYITFQPYNNETVIIEPSKTYDSWTPQGNGIYSREFTDFEPNDGELVKKDGYGITRVNTYAELSDPNISADGNAVLSLNGMAANNVDLFYFDDTNNLLSVKLGSGTPNDVYVINYCNRVEMGWPDTDAFIEINGFTIQYTYEGIKSYGNYCKIINNTIKHNSISSIFAPYGDDLLIQDNNISYTGAPLKYHPSDPNLLIANNQDHSIYVKNTERITIKNNTTGRCIGGQSLECDSNDCEIYDNYIEGGYVGYGSNNKNNIIYNNKIYNNIFTIKYNTCDGFLLEYASNHQVCNNTIIAPYPVILGLYSDLQNLTFKNNIAYSEGAYCMHRGNFDLSSADINNNAYYGGHIFRVGYPDWNEFSDFNSYQAYMKNNHNLEANSFYADPDFVDPNNGDYHLGLNSPCINNGDNNVVSWDYDIDGEPRVQGKYVDIGADEARRVRRIHDGNDEWYVYIQDAINEASDGDEIVVYPGTYYESVDFGGKAITLSSAEPNDLDVIKSTIIDGNGAANVVETDSNAILKGLTITGGQRGVYCSASTPVISNCIIRDNSGEGIYAESSTITVRNSLIYDNNEGITLQNTDGTVRNDTIVNNANYGIRVGGNIPSISNCILWNNNDDLYNCSATYSCIEDGDSGTGNISSDPCFVNADNNDFHINIHSPCINAGDPNGDYNDQNDIDGQARVIGRCVDIGADEVDINAPEPNGHWWKLDETSGTTAYDSVDNNNGTFNGDDPCWVTGHIGGAADFNDVSDYFSVSSLNTAYTSSSNFTIAGWFKTSQSTGIQTIVGNWSQYRYIPHPGVNLDFYYGWQVIVENKKVVARFGGSSPNTTSDITGTSDVNDGNWHHFAVVHPSYQGQYTPNSVLYVDGQSEGTPGAQYFSYSNTKFRIGDGSYVSSGSPVLKGGPFCGTIDDVMIFNRALTANEVYQLYIAGR